MPRLKLKTVYAFAELSDSAKETARAWWREGALDYDWWDSVYDDFHQILEILGYCVDQKEIQFSGFWSQGDGASFTGSYAYRLGAAREIRNYAPRDTRLHAIADDLQKMQSRNFYKVTGQISRGYRAGNCVHEMTMSCEVDRADGACWSQAATRDADNAFEEASRDLARWLYRALESEHDYLTSDEAADESLACNEYEFDESGKVA